MSRRQHLENIIIGTLLDIADHYPECRSCITADMFRDERNQRIYEMVTQMRSDGTTLTDPYSIYQRYGEKVVELIPYMVNLCSEYAFEWKKVKYNEEAFIDNLLLGTSKQPTGVEFSDYVNEFLKIVMSDEKATKH